MAASASSSSPFLGIRDEELKNQMKSQQQQQQQQQQSSSAPPAPPKKRRNQPGNPTAADPDAEVIALSPKTLMATNRFLCEVCGKGFQREQNLQLHRRGHNLPWKLRLKSGKEAARRRVYLCPEPSCVHHDPARALGDLTGIKKHFCRKHGEKKWKCDKCSKKYAVHSDLKAHAKTCGTREYRCDCGTLFSRRDSFITHRAFCDALSQESSRLPAAGLGPLNGHLYGNNAMAFGLSHVNSQLISLQDQNHTSSDLRLGGRAGGGTQFDHFINPLSSNPSAPFRQPPAFYLGSGSNHGFSDEQPPPPPPPLLQSKPFHGLIQLPAVQANANASLFNLGFGSEFNGAGNGSGEPASLFSGNLMSDHLGVDASLYGSEANVFPRMSATALLQKAAQMGSMSASCGEPSLLRGYSSGDTLHTQMENDTNQLQSLMNSLANGSSAGLFTGPDAFGGNCAAANEHQHALEENEVTGEFGAFDTTGLGNVEDTKFNLASAAAAAAAAEGGFRGSNRLTRDFLGVGSMVRSIGGAGMSRRESSHGIDMSLLDPK